MMQDLPEPGGARNLAIPTVTCPDETPRARRLARLQFGFTLALTTGVLVYLLWPGGQGAGNAAVLEDPRQGPLRLTEAGHIELQPDSPLGKKLQVTRVKPERIAAPILTVTGSVVASLRPIRGGGRTWQFDSPELLTTYNDWQKAIADIAFTKTQQDAVGQLAENRVAAQEALVRRLAKLVEAGTETEKDLATAQTELLQARVQGQKDRHEAESAWRLAQRAEAALGGQLQQAGLDPDLLRAAGAEIDVVVADVPEALLSRVKLGQGCEARFLGTGDKRFTGSVRSISPVLSRERRSLRVLFTIDDPEDLLRPGMFAEIGLGTDARDTLLAPIEGVVHVGRADYLLVRAPDGGWRATAVQVGELHEAGVEILEGLRAGDQIVGQGAILLKPIIIEALQGSLTQGAGS